ncbi:hypothetical protein DFH11DRAFT_1565703, partial [Phellopilus nigrolimitatus]
RTHLAARCVADREPPVHLSQQARLPLETRAAPRSSVWSATRTALGAADASDGPVHDGRVSAKADRMRRAYHGGAETDAVLQPRIAVSRGAHTGPPRTRFPPALLNKSTNHVARCRARAPRDLRVFAVAAVGFRISPPRAGHFPCRRTQAPLRWRARLLRPSRARRQDASGSCATTASRTGRPDDRPRRCCGTRSVVLPPGW